jgi:tetraacyldisaccharide 4'-kinase
MSSLNIKKTFHALYQCGLRLRHHAYDQGWFSSCSVPACVVSVGNIAWGGTGKTPLVQKIAKELSGRHRVAILSRGYRGGAEYFDPPLLVSDGRGPLVDAALAGDEAFLHAACLSNVAVWSSKYRVKAARLAIAQGAEVLILDDGMQHRNLKRDFEIITFDGRGAFFKQALLPFGEWRDLPERLRCADLIVVNHAKEGFAEEFKGIRSFTDAPIIATKMVPNRESIEAISNKKVAMFCAIGRPQNFESTLLSLGIEIVDRWILRDHSPICKKKFDHFAKRAKNKGAEILVCTRKDFVKLPTHEHQVVVIDAEPTIISGEAAWEKCLKEITERSHKTASKSKGNRS